jgi:uncharacterized membrane protein
MLSHRLRHRLAGLARDERGLSSLEKLGLTLLVVVVLAFIPAARSIAGDLWEKVFGQVDDAGNPTGFSIAAKGILIVLVAIVAFVGSGYLVISTNLGRRLAFLITGAAVFGWLVVGSMLFVVYAPRGLRPSNLTGLNAFQMRIPAIGLGVASLILFLMFVVALDRYEKEKDRD